MIGRVAREERRARQARDALAGFDRRLPEGGLGRVLALWGFAGVPFFRAFREPAGGGEATPEPRVRNAAVRPAGRRAR